jgi:hypothetical protein
MGLTSAQGALVWKLDTRINDGGNRIELVASDLNHLPVPTHFEHRNVFQLKMCLRVSHRISDSWQVGLWNVRICF